MDQKTDFLTRRAVKRFTLRTMEDRVNALECEGEVEGFLAQLHHDGTHLTDELARLIKDRLIALKKR